jgi:hypothetical protein
MKSLIAVAVVAGLALGVAAAYADSHERIVVIWTCKLNEEKTQDDVQTANKKWVKLMNDTVEGGDIRSFVLTTVIGSDTEVFLYADSFPSMESWNASRKVIQSEAGQAIEAELNEVATCSSNSLYESEES